MVNRWDDSFEDEPFEQFSSERTSAQARPLSMNELRQRLMHRAVSYLSRREHSQTELKRKLQLSFADQAFTPDEQFASLDALIEHILAHLAQNNWQSDARFAAQIGKVKGERYGTARIKHTLNQQGLAKELVDETVAELAQSERQRAYAVWQKKFGTPPANSAEYAKQTRFMAYRGFSFDIIKQVIRGDVQDFDAD